MLPTARRRVHVFMALFALLVIGNVVASVAAGLPDRFDGSRNRRALVAFLVLQAIYAIGLVVISRRIRLGGKCYWGGAAIGLHLFLTLPGLAIAYATSKQQPPLYLMIVHAAYFTTAILALIMIAIASSTSNVEQAPRDST